VSRSSQEVLGSNGVRVTVIKTLSLLDMLSEKGLDCDLYYFARFVPPLVDRGLVRISKVSMPIIYGFHSPLKIDYTVRPYHKLYNVVMPLQAMRASVLSRRLHLLNLDDLKLAFRMGLASKSVYLLLGTNTEVFKPTPKNQEFTVIYASRASWNKGTDILVTSIVPQLVKKAPSIRIVIVSYGFLIHLYEGLKKYRNVYIIPYLPLSEYARVLSSSHVLLFPSRYESYGLVVLEALACGTIPVAFNVRGFVRDILSKDPILKRFVVEYPKVGSLVSRVIELYNIWLRNPQLFAFLMNYSRRLANKFSWVNVGKLWLSMFKEVLMKAQ